MMPAKSICYKIICIDRVHHPDLTAATHLHNVLQRHLSNPSIFAHYGLPSPSFVILSTSSLHNGGSKNSLQELEKNATATPKTAILLTTLAFSGEVKVLYALER